MKQISFLSLLLLVACPFGSQTTLVEMSPAEPDPVPEADPEANPEAKPEAEPEPEAKPIPEPEPEPEAKPEAEPEPPKCDPLPGDEVGGVCCAPVNRESCAGRDVQGRLPKRRDAGSTLVCLEGKWVEDDSDCTEVCESKGYDLLGCIWDSKRGLTKPLCACK